MKKGLLSFLNLDAIIENLSGYVEKRIELLKLELKEDLAIGAARLLILLILSVSLFMILLLVSVALSLWLNKILQSEFIGFLILAGFYLIIFLVFLFLKDQSNIENKLKNIFVKIFENLGEENGD